MKSINLWQLCVINRELTHDNHAIKYFKSIDSPNIYVSGIKISTLMQAIDFLSLTRKKLSRGGARFHHHTLNC